MNNQGWFDPEFIAGPKGSIMGRIMCPKGPYGPMWPIRAHVGPGGPLCCRRKTTTTAQTTLLHACKVIRDPFGSSSVDRGACFLARVHIGSNVHVQTYMCQIGSNVDWLNRRLAQTFIGSNVDWFKRRLAQTYSVCGANIHVS